MALISEALAVAHEIGDRSREMVYLSNLGAVRVGLGEYTAAEADLRQAIEQGEAAGGAGFFPRPTGRWPRRCWVRIILRPPKARPGWRWRGARRPGA